jgi:hypothetical protein
LVVAFDYQTMPLMEMMGLYVLSKLMAYSTIPPTPISIEEFMAMRGIKEERGKFHTS